MHFVNRCMRNKPLSRSLGDGRTRDLQDLACFVGEYRGIGYALKQSISIVKPKVVGLATNVAI